MNPETDGGRYSDNLYDHYQRSTHDEGRKRYDSYGESSSKYWESSGSGMEADPQEASTRMEQGEKDNDEEEDFEEETSFCELCNVSFDDPQKYFMHTRGMLHTQRQMVAKAEQMVAKAEQEKEESWQKPEHQPPFRKFEPQQDERLKQGENWQRHSQHFRTETAPRMDQDEDKKEEEEDDSDEEDTTFCKLCSVHFDDAQKYYRHTRGLMHTQRQVEEKMKKQGQAQEYGNSGQGPENQPMDQAGSWQQPPQTKKPETGVTTANDDEDYWEEEDWGDEDDKDPNAFVCELCDIKTTGIMTLRAHQKGRSHKAVQDAVDNGTPVPQRIFSRLGPNAKIPAILKPVTAGLSGKPAGGPSVLLQLLKSVREAVVGTELVREGHVANQPSFFCTVCDCQCDATGIQTHIIGGKHRMKYLRDHHPTVYEHVKSHGGKKSQLSAFLEEVCTDIENKEGRKKPLMEKSEDDTGMGNKEKEPEENTDERTGDEERSIKKDGQKKNQEMNKEQAKPAKGRKEQLPGAKKRHLPHDVVMARYREAKMKTEEGYGPLEPHEGGGWGGPAEPFAFRHGPDFGPRMGGCGPDFGPMGPRMDRPGPEFGPRRPRMGGPGPEFGSVGPRMGGPGPDFGRMGPDFRMDRDLFYEFPRRPDPFMDYPAPLPYLSEEERHDRMYEYERHLFYHPMLDISPEEARRLMFLEYERLGIPYDIACSRVLIQEERLVQLTEYMKGGMSLRDAQARLVTMENRKQLVREYEQSGLDPREARWRAVVEEERNRLYEDYERQGFTPLQARAKIMAGDARIHLTREFERQGMAREEAHHRAIAEEDRLKNLEASLKSGRGEYDNASSREQALDDVANKRMLENYMEDGDTREQAENKVIAILRRQGVPTQEAIMRVQKIEVRVPQKSQKYDEEKKQDLGQEQKYSNPSEKFDGITPEEAKERLFQEYEKRGVPREKARIVLIQELVRSGVPEEEAKRRFSDTRPIETAKRERDSRRERGGKSRKYTGYDHSRSRSSSSSLPSSPKQERRSPFKDDKKYSKSRKDYRDRSGVRNDGPRRQEEIDVRDEGPWRQEESDVWNERQRRREEIDTRDERQRRRQEALSYRNEDRYNRGATAKDRDDERSSEFVEESKARPTLTLGEELKLKAKKIKLAEFLSRLEEKSVPAKHTTAVSQSSAQIPLPGGSRNEDMSSVSNLLESLTDNLISSEDNESVALSMSKALTSALLKYRLSDAKEKPSGSTTQSSFVQRRIEDAKKLFETKMHPQKEKQSSSYGGNQDYGLQPSSSGLGLQQVFGNYEYMEMPRVVRPESFGLPPPLPANAQQVGRQNTTMSSLPRESVSSQPRFQQQASKKKKPTIPRVLIASDSKETPSSRKLYRH